MLKDTDMASTLFNSCIDCELANHVLLKDTDDSGEIRTRNLSMHTLTTDYGEIRTRNFSMHTLTTEPFPHPPTLTSESCYYDS